MATLRILAVMWLALVLANCGGTSNEPSATVTDPPWSIILYRIFVGTGIFMIAAVVLGIAFGGLRVFTKRLLPGKIFDRAERMEVLQLGLTGKTIDPRDFY